MPPQFVGIQDSGEHRTSREGAQGGVNLRCAAAGEAGTFEGEKRSDGFWVAGHTKQLARREAGSTLQEQGSGQVHTPRIEIRNPAKAARPRKRGRARLPASVPQSRATRRNRRAQASTRQPSSARTM